MSRPRLFAAAIVALAVFVAVAVTGAPAAFAAFTSARSAALTIGAATVHAPSGVTAAVTCTSPTSLTVSWTGSSGITPTSYTISAIKNQTGSVRANTVSGSATTTSFSIPSWTSYTVQIQAGYNSWTSSISSKNGTVSCS
jgi:hypothetical protein